MIGGMCTNNGFLDSRLRGNDKPIYMFDKLIQIWKARDLRNSILFVLAMLAIFRVAAHIPVPGVDAAALRDFFSSNQILGLMNIFAGGGMQNFSIVMMGV